MSILVVEDEVSIAQLIKRGLELEQYAVELAHDGNEGLAKALVNEYDLIMLDVMLPGIDGIEILKTLRQKLVRTPVIMLSARATIEDQSKGLEAGANDYLAKPFIFSELIARIKALLGSGKDGNAAVELAAPIREDGVSYGDNGLDEPYGRQASDAACRVTAEERDRLSELNSKILDNAPISVITVDRQGYITSANKYFDNFSKTRSYRNHNIFDSEFFIREGLVEDYRKLLVHGTVVRRENCYEKNNRGEDKYLKIIAVPLRDQHGDIEGALSMAIDNTETVLFKNKLEELNGGLEKMIEQRTTELYEANRELAKVLELKSTFMADVSHELRTSLTIIQGNLELMTLRSPILAGNQESYSQVFNEIKRMSSMLADLTSLTTAESSSQKLNYEKIDLNRLIASVCKSLSVMADDKGIRLEHRNGAAVIEMMADGDKLEKLLSNLIRNAIRYNKDNGWINVWAEVAASEISLHVEDGGIGIAEEYLPFIFERFYRVDKARSRNEGGSGLGLAICKWIAEIHGGKIEVRSQEGRGTIFTVRLPRKAEQGQE
jgi:signal transduction histidine kinase/DNA-binding response OmpR family regulator